MLVKPHERFSSEVTLTALDGEILDLRGRIRNEEGKTAIGAKGRVLVTEKL